MQKNFNLRRFVVTALLVAIILIMAFTPLGYLRTPALEITFITIPVIVGAIMLGPWYGAFLGFVFGMTSFIQCFGASQFGTALLAINPFATFITCVPTRTLMGLLTGLIFKSLFKRRNPKLYPFVVTALSGALLNTVFFVGTLMGLFGSSDLITGIRAGKHLVLFLAAFIGVQGLVEALVAMVVGSAVSRALYNVFDLN